MLFPAMLGVPSVAKKNLVVSILEFLGSMKTVRHIPEVENFMVS